MTLLGNFVRTSGQGEQILSWRSMNDMNSRRSSLRAISCLMRMRILTSHASFAPFVPYERIMFSLSGHLYKISQQSHVYKAFSSAPARYDILNQTIWSDSTKRS